jgi:mono/diheme cytochrome c family protein
VPQRILLVVTTLAALAVVGCSETPFDGPVTLQGASVPAATLNLGHDTYQLYCRACHGVNGDGRGPASSGLHPAPRDFRRGVFKFGRVRAGELPTDADLRRTIRGGLAGTAMLPWDLDDEALNAVIQYIKTFSEVWRDADSPQDEPIVLPEDPWGESQRAKAIAAGQELYHGLAQCNTCHPSYVPYEEIRRARRAATGLEPEDLGPAFYRPRDHADQYVDPRLRVPPPDFTWQPMRAARDLEQLYLTIAAGIGGTAMPTWDDALSARQLWALTHYVQSLIELRGTPGADRLRRELASQPLPVYPSTPTSRG